MASEYPNLLSQVTARAAAYEGEGDIVSNDIENVIVAQLVEELLTQPSKPSESDVGGSNLRRSNTSVPGAWL